MYDRNVRNAIESEDPPAPKTLLFRGSESRFSAHPIYFCDLSPASPWGWGGWWKLLRTWLSGVIENGSLPDHPAQKHENVLSQQRDMNFGKMKNISLQTPISRVLHYLTLEDPELFYFQFRIFFIFACHHYYL